MAGRGRDATLPAWMRASGIVPGPSAIGGSQPPPPMPPPPPPTSSYQPIVAPAPRVSSRFSSAAAPAPARRPHSRSRSRSPVRSGAQYSSSTSGASNGYGFAATSAQRPGLTSGVDTRALIAAAMANSSSAAAGGSAATRTARRLHIGGISGVTEVDVMRFFNDAISRVWTPGEHVVSVYVNHEKKFGFIEFKDVGVCTAVQANMDGIIMNGQKLALKRPNDYTPPPVSLPTPPLSFNMAALGPIGGGILPGVSSMVPDGPGKVFVGGLPSSLGEAEVAQLLESFGPLRGLHLVRDPGSLTTKGYGFFEYKDHAVTEGAIAGLHGLPLGDRQLTVRRAEGARGAPAPLPTIPAQGLFSSAVGGSTSSGVAAAAGGSGGLDIAAIAAAAVAAVGVGGSAQLQHPGAASGLPARHDVGGEPPLPPPPPPPPSGASSAAGSRTLRLTNMVTPDEVADDREYEEIRDDVRSELVRFGTVMALVIPRGGPHVGSIVVEYAEPAAAAAAAKALAGRIFSGRTVGVRFE